MGRDCRPHLPGNTMHATLKIITLVGESVLLPRSLVYSHRVKVADAAG